MWELRLLSVVWYCTQVQVRAGALPIVGTQTFGIVINSGGYLGRARAVNVNPGVNPGDNFNNGTFSEDKDQEQNQDLDGYWDAEDF